MKLLVSLISRLVACSARTVVDRQADRQTHGTTTVTLAAHAFIEEMGAHGYSLFLHAIREEKEHIGHEQLHKILSSSRIQKFEIGIQSGIVVTFKCKEQEALIYYYSTLLHSLHMDRVRMVLDNKCACVAACNIL